MLGVRSAQRGLLEADHLYLDYVGRDSFYGFLASMRGQLFRDEEFAELYCPDNGRDSVPPSLVATALLLQAYDKVSDAEAKQRADFDIRWKVALGIEVEDRPFAKSTLQLFRAQLILHDRVRAVFQRSLQLARQTGYLKGRRMKVAVDTTYILGRGAVKDTYNLLADGIVQVVAAVGIKGSPSRPLDDRYRQLLCLHPVWTYINMVLTALGKLSTSLPSLVSARSRVPRAERNSSGVECHADATHPSPSRATRRIPIGEPQLES